MRRPLIAVALAVSALAVSACASSTAPGWTYAPPTEAPAVTPAPSGSASEAPATGAPASEAPTDGGNAAGAVKIEALNIAWVNTEVSAPADAPFVIEFDNQDAGIPHNVEIKDSMNAQVFLGEIVTGPITTQYQVPALAAGDYAFVCTVHPNMVGNLKVGG